MVGRDRECSFFQLLFGALIAGNKAAQVAPTWPTINGAWIPDHLFSTSPLLINFIENTITIQFVHRLLAYILLLLTTGWTTVAYRSAKTTPFFRQARLFPLLVLCVQVVLGISALLTSPGIIANRWVLFDWVAQVHQVTGLLFLLTMIYMLFLVRPLQACNT